MPTTTSLEKLGVHVISAGQPIGPDFDLSVFVVFTSANQMRKALAKASEIAGPLGANIVIVAVQTVPYPLPLDEPPVRFEFVVQRLEEEVGTFPENTQIKAFLCRDRMDAYKGVLSPGCPVVIGIKRKKWWPACDEKLARKLLRAGYSVIRVDTE